MATKREIEAGRAYVRLFLKDDFSSKLARALKSAGKQFTAVGKVAAAAGAAIVGVFTSAVLKFASFGDTLNKMSIRTGVSVEALSELKFAAEQSGASIDDLGAVLLKMNRRFGRVSAGEGSSTQVDAIAALGLSIEHLNGLDAEGRFLAIADAMSKYGDNAAAAGLAQRIFGTSVDRLLPLIFAGTEGIKKLREEAKKLGITMSEEDAQAAADLTDAMNRLKQVVGAAFVKIGAAVGPSLSDLSEHITKIVVDLHGWIEANGAAIRTFLKFGAVLTGIGGVLIGTGLALNVMATAIGGVSVAVAFLMANPLILLAAGMVAVTAAVIHFTSKTAKMSTAMSDVRQKADEQRTADQALMEELQGLADKQSLTNDEMERAETILSNLETRYGDLGVTIDSTTGKINGMASAQASVNKTMREAALADLHREALEAENNIAKLNRELGSFGTAAKDLVGAAFGSDAVFLDIVAEIEVEAAKLKVAQLRIRAALSGDADAITGGGPSAAGPITGGLGSLGGSTSQAQAFNERILDHIADMRIARIEDEHERAVAAIDKRYDREIERAKELGASQLFVAKARMDALADEEKAHQKIVRAEKFKQVMAAVGTIGKKLGFFPGDDTLDTPQVQRPSVAGIALTATHSAAAARISGFQPGGPEKKMVAGIERLDKKAERIVVVVEQFLAGQVVQ